MAGLRRTIWDGSQELGEIQLPTEHLENDSYVGQGTFTSSSLNLAPFYGAVAYAYDGRIDQPLAIQRLRYANLTPSNTIVELAAFTYHPVWSVQGIVDIVVGDTGTLPAPVCAESMVGGTRATCLSWVLRRHALAYRDVSTLWPNAWQGTLLLDKVGAGGLMYRRNRYYDSKSGRFTQEDPIGLAGGLNLYGYANGDPVNFSDPFGLCDPMKDEGCSRFQQFVDWTYAKSGSGALLIGLAGFDAAMSAAAAMFGDPASASPAGALAGGLLFRLGTKAETAADLAAQAARAEAAGLPHGVSAFSRTPSRSAASRAAREAVEQHFPVTQTGGNPAHHTVRLPKPVTQQVADLFNRLFGRTP